MASIKRAGEKLEAALDSSKPEFKAFRGGKSDGMTLEDIANKHGISVDTMKKQLAKGIEIEYEHTRIKQVAQRIAMDHIEEIPDYYDRLIAMEREAGIKESYQRSVAGMPKPDDVGTREYKAVYEAMRFGYDVDAMAQMATEIRNMIPEVACTKLKVLAALPVSDPALYGFECSMVSKIVREAVMNSKGDPVGTAHEVCCEIIENVEWVKSKAK